MRRSQTNLWSENSLESFWIGQMGQINGLRPVRAERKVVHFWVTKNQMMESIIGMGTQHASCIFFFFSCETWLSFNPWCGQSQWWQCSLRKILLRLLGSPLLVLLRVQTRQTAFDLSRPPHGSCKRPDCPKSWWVLKRLIETYITHTQVGR